jgi:hypothetical protein
VKNSSFGADANAGRRDFPRASSGRGSGAVLGSSSGPQSFGSSAQQFADRSGFSGYSQYRRDSYGQSHGHRAVNQGSHTSQRDAPAFAQSHSNARDQFRDQRGHRGGRGRGGYRQHEQDGQWKSFDVDNHAN